MILIGRVAQSIEHRLDKAGAVGLIPTVTTILLCPAGAIGSASVSKTEGWGFETLAGCHLFNGRMPESV